MNEDPVNILHCCGGHEDHIDSCPMLWDESELFETAQPDFFGDEQNED